MAEQIESREAVTRMPEGRITDEALAELRGLIGTELRINNIFNLLASKEAIRNFANGVGDPNPLWRDEEYAANSPYKSIVAPPSWLYSVFPTWVSVGLRGVHGFHSGTDWEFLKPIKCGDQIRPVCVLSDVKVKESKFAEKIAILYYDSTFYNQREELVAKARSWSIRAERHTARKKGKYFDIKLPHPWTEEELRRIEEEVLSEEVRGPHVRYWEDVEIGEALKPVVKGPFGLTDMIAFCIGAPPVNILAHHMALKLYRKHPAWAFRDPNTYALEPIYGVHYNRAAANAAGLPYPYDVGTQRHCWLIHLLTNWIGDDGWLKANYAEYRAFVYHSDVVWFRGRVTRKYVSDDGEPCVDIETSAVNQRGELTMPGHSTVVLPSQERGTWPVARRLT
jgi:acyl dehydratase